MAVGKSSEQPLNCCHHASCVLCAESEALVVHERATSWHRAGSSHFSLRDTFSGCRIYHDGNAGLGGLTTYSPGGSSLPGGCSSTKALARNLGGAQERSLPPPSPAMPVDGLGTSAGTLHHIPCFLSSLSFLTSFSLSLPRCSLVSSNLRGTSSEQCRISASALWSELLELAGKTMAWVWQWRSSILQP